MSEMIVIGLFSASALCSVIATLLALLDFVPFLFTVFRSNYETAQMEAPVRIIKVAVWSAFISVILAIQVSSMAHSEGMAVIGNLSNSIAWLDVFIMFFVFQRVNKR
jgi:hypothetical protein